MYIDSHAHIFSEDFKSDAEEVLQRAWDAGVDRVIVPGTTLETSREAVELSERHSGVYACVGFHPHEASLATDELLAGIEELARERKVVAIGEIGLDFHYDFSPRDRQREVLRAQIEMAIRRDLPVVIHTRESLDETIALVTTIVGQNNSWRKNGTGGDGRGKGVFHCFTGDAAQANVLFELGFWVSYPGIVTFKNSPVVGTLRVIGLDRILLETDSPYLAPVPLRGKRNEPCNIPLIAAKIAEVLQTTPEVVGEKTSENTRRLFALQE